MKPIGVCLDYLKKGKLAKSKAKNYVLDHFEKSDTEETGRSQTDHRDSKQAKLQIQNREAKSENPS